MERKIQNESFLIRHSALRKLIYIILIFVVVQGLIMLKVITPYLQDTLMTICINIILAVSLNLITGFTGQFSLGHAGFMSIGAYTCALIVLRMPTVWGLLLSIPAAILLAGIVGLAVGLPTLRLRGDYLAIATLGFAEIIRIIFVNLDSLTNGAAGISGLPRLVDWPLMFVFTAGTVLLIGHFIKSRHGRACVSIRENEIASETMGVPSTRYKVTAFIIGACFAGMAGALYASYFYVIKPETFGFMKSIDILIIVVFGGLGSLTGSVLSSIVLAVISAFLADLSAKLGIADLRMVLYALLLIIIMIFRPQGLMGSKEVSLALFKKIGKGLSLNKKKERV
jgi:branched-chain amino acid transport system permease protein